MPARRRSWRTPSRRVRSEAGHPRQAPSIATCTASSMSDTMRRPPPWDSATSPVLRATMLRARARSSTASISSRITVRQTGASVAH